MDQFKKIPHTRTGMGCHKQRHRGFSSARTVYLLFCFICAVQTGIALPCQNLPASTESLEFVNQKYSCVDALNELHLEYLLEIKETMCPPGTKTGFGTHGAECSSECDAGFFAIVNNSTDARLCGCITLGGCAIRDRMLSTPELLGSQLSLVVVIPKSITQATSTVLCETPACDIRKKVHNPPTPVRDVLFCENYNIPYQGCPVCDEICYNDEQSECFLSKNRESCEVACKEGYFYDGNDRCRKCRKCPINHRRVSECNSNTKTDSKCEMCPRNFVSDDANECIACPDGKYRQPHQKTCIAKNYVNATIVECAPDHVLLDGVCTQCPDGLVRPASVKEQVCRPASRQTKCPLEGHVFVQDSGGCEPCNSRSIPDKNENTCKECPPGRISSGNTCIPCERGKFLENHTSNHCSTCNLGPGVPCPDNSYLDRCSRALGEYPCSCSCRLCPFTESDAVTARGEMILSGSECRITCSTGYRSFDYSFEWELVSNITQGPHTILKMGHELSIFSGERSRFELNVAQWYDFHMYRHYMYPLMNSTAGNVYAAVPHRIKCVQDSFFLRDAEIGLFVLSNSNRSDAIIYSCDEIIQNSKQQAQSLFLEGVSWNESDYSQKGIFSTALFNYVKYEWQDDSSVPSCRYRCRDGYEFRLFTESRRPYHHCVQFSPVAE